MDLLFFYEMPVQVVCSFSFWMSDVSYLLVGLYIRPMRQASWAKLFVPHPTVHHMPLKFSIYINRIKMKMLMIY